MSLFSELKRRNVIRVAIAYVAFAWLTIQVVETLFPIYGLTDAHIRIVVALLAIGSPLLLIFSWLYELTPEGLKLDRDVDRTQSITSYTGKKLDRVIIAVLTLAVGFFAVDKFVLDPTRDAEREAAVREEARSEAVIESYGENSIAVLPFENMSADPDDEVFSDGMSEELLNLLARIPELRVISRSSSFAFKDTDLTVPDIAEQLNVALVLEGSVRRFGEDLRVTAQLIEARSDSHLWSDTYDAKMEDLFAVQDEISAAIVDALSTHLERGVSRAPLASVAANREAHDAYLMGRHLIAQRSDEAGRQAVREFEIAVALDPEFAPAHAELALAIGRNTLLGELSREEKLELLANHVSKALVLDPALPEAHAARGWLQWHLYDSVEAEAAFRRAIDLNPNYAMAYVWLAQYLSDLEEAFANQEIALSLDPLSRPANFNHIDRLLARGRVTEANRWLDRLEMFDPAAAILLRGKRDAAGGNWSRFALAYLEAAKNAPNGLTYGPTYRSDFVWLLAAVGLPEEAKILRPAFPQVLEVFYGSPERGVEMAEERFRKDKLHYNFGMVLAHVGLYDRAHPLLEHDWTVRRASLLKGKINDNEIYEARFAEALIYMRRRAGDEAGAQELIDALNANVQRFRKAGITESSRNKSVDFHAGIAAYYSGDRDNGLELIAKAVDGGVAIVPEAAFQHAMFDDPGFSPILAVQEARQERERARILDVVCNDNPYAEVWQPMPETCDAQATYKVTENPANQ
jgi:adenylate cyclase